MATTTIQVRYTRGHSYEETWKTSDYKCVHCGIGSGLVWVHPDQGDDGCDTDCLCIACGTTFTLSGTPQRGDEGDGATDDNSVAGWDAAGCAIPGRYQIDQRLKAIRTAIGGGSAGAGGSSRCQE